MTTQHPLEARITHKYVGTYAHLDQWDTIGGYVIVASSKPVCTDEEDICEPMTQVHFLRIGIDPGTKPTKEAIKAAIEDTFTKVGCHHEYDCCGCRSYYAKAKRAGEYWAVTISSSRNF